MNWFRTLLDILARLLGRFKDPRPVALTLTSGPPLDEHPPVPLTSQVAAETGQVAGMAPWNPHDAWDSGWWRGAVRTLAFPGRVGGTIIPRTVVVHTTDTMPGGFQAIVRSWTKTLGPGCCAHFMIGRSAEDGVVQFCPITKNGNHAGGPVHGHGWWRFPKPDGGMSGLVHPNLLAVGIEIDCGGALVKKQTSGGTTYVIQPDTGREVPTEDVFWDPAGRPWHKVTQYQLDTLRQLLRDIGPCLKPLPIDVEVVPNGDYKGNGVPWAAPYRNDLVEHVTLDPNNKTDAGPQVYQWLKVNFPNRTEWE